MHVLPRIEVSKPLSTLTDLTLLTVMFLAFQSLNGTFKRKNRSLTSTVRKKQTTRRRQKPQFSRVTSQQRKSQRNPWPHRIPLSRADRTGCNLLFWITYAATHNKQPVRIRGTSPFPEQTCQHPWKSARERFFIPSSHAGDVDLTVTGTCNRSLGSVEAESYFVV